MDLCPVTVVVEATLAYLRSAESVMVQQWSEASAGLAAAPLQAAWETAVVVAEAAVLAVLLSVTCTSSHAQAQCFGRSEEQRLVCSEKSRPHVVERTKVTY